jgi:hypothetical protein
MISKPRTTERKARYGRRSRIRLSDLIAWRFDFMFLRTGVITCHDRNAVKEKPIEVTAASYLFRRQLRPS